MISTAKKQLEGYMTVEATLILSVVVLLYLFLIRSFFLVYDRCLLEQDLAAMAMRCAYAEEEDLKKAWLREVENWDVEQYLWITLKEPTLRREGWKLEVFGGGDEGQSGEVEIQYEIWQLTPEDWLRGKRKAGQISNTQKEEVEE